MADPTLISVTVQDDAGVKASTLVAVDYDAATTLVSALIANAMEFGSMINALTDGIVTEVRLIVPLLPDGAWRTSPVANCDVEETALFVFDQLNTKYAQTIDIPAIAQSKLADGRVNLSDSAVTDFIERLTNQTAVTGGLLHNGMVFANSMYHNALKSLRSVQKTFRKHRRALKKQTLEGPG